MPEADGGARRPRTRRLMLACFAAWLIFGFAVYMSFDALNRIEIPVIGSPLGLYVAAQGALIAFVVMLFAFAWQRDRDERGED
ncbi:MAG TPA: DUF4212 domain-containing protein [Pseudolabrys sp.]|jgi:putative solute:sodium symporter small subunit|nr:DUF4212 domain-containing protein [Pseudolabrys sp.]